VGLGVNRFKNQPFMFQENTQNYEKVAKQELHNEFEVPKRELGNQAFSEQLLFVYFSLRAGFFPGNCRGRYLLGGLVFGGCFFVFLGFDAGVFFAGRRLLTFFGIGRGYFWGFGFGRFGCSLRRGRFLNLGGGRLRLFSANLGLSRERQPQGKH
jgi:hypothetical protein